MDEKEIKRNEILWMDVVFENVEVIRLFPSDILDLKLKCVPIRRNDNGIVYFIDPESYIRVKIDEKLPRKTDNLFECYGQNKMTTNKMFQDRLLACYPNDITMLIIGLQGKEESLSLLAFNLSDDSEDFGFGTSIPLKDGSLIVTFRLKDDGHGKSS